MIGNRKHTKILKFYYNFVIFKLQIIFFQIPYKFSFNNFYNFIKFENINF